MYKDFTMDGHGVSVSTVKSQNADAAMLYWYQVTANGETREFDVRKLVEFMADNADKGVVELKEGVTVDAATLRDALLNDEETVEMCKWTTAGDGFKDICPACRVTHVYYLLIDLPGDSNARLEWVKTNGHFIGIPF